MTIAGVRDASTSASTNDVTSGSASDVPTAAVQHGGRPFDQSDFRRAMGRFTTGVTVVSGLGQAGEPFGVTVNAFMSVSLEPPLVAVSLRRGSRSHAALSAAERFAVSVLAQDQAEVSDRFAGRPVPPAPAPFVDYGGLPVVAGAIAHVAARRVQGFDAGDHTIFVGEVEALRSLPGEPLVYHGGRYGALAPAPEPSR